ncbi:MAG: glycoside hydrolase family 13 protein [Mycobacteriaceae bacterium]
MTTTTAPTPQADPGLPGPDWVRDAVFYQIFPERFDNADPRTNPPNVQPWGAPPTRDNFFGGDLPGITRRLPHLSRLGVNALYLTPVFAAATNHRYDAVDYNRIDPLLGGDAAFESFLEEAHAADIRVLLDAVFNHCGDQHPYFRDVVEKQADSAYVNWFSVAGFPVQPEPDPNYLTCSGCSYLPKLNAHNPQVREHLFNAASKWMNAGIDGWRLDVPYMLENPFFWQQFRHLVKSHDPNLYICAEVWEEATPWTDGTTSDGAMNYRLRDAILSFVTEWRGGGETFATDLAAIDTEIRPEAKGLMLNLLGSHDTERLITHCGGDTDAVKLAFALLFSAEGAPMVYYGDEIGLPGFNDPDCRRCMPWNQDDWNTDILNWVTTLADLRRENIALRRGSEETVAATENLIVRRRSHPEQTVIIAANRHAQPTTTAVPGGGAGVDLLTGAPIDLARIDVPGKGVRLAQVSS